jgi:hypothetical protein
MSERPSSTAEPQSPPSRQTFDKIEIRGEVRLRASISMLFTDLLSQELNAALSTPNTVNLLQKHIQNRSLEQLSQRELQPLLENIPDSVLDIAKEAAFSSGALLKRADCVMALSVGDPFVFRGSGLMAELEMKDGRVVGIDSLQKR